MIDLTVIIQNKTLDLHRHKNQTIMRVYDPHNVFIKTDKYNYHIFSSDDLEVEYMSILVFLDGILNVK